MVSEPQTIQEHLQLLSISGILALLSSSIASRCGFFQIQQRPYPPLINLWELIGAFVVFLVVSLFVVPLIAVLWVGSPEEVSELDIVAQGWFNVLSMALSAFGVLGYYRILEKRVRNAVWRSSPAALLPDPAANPSSTQIAFLQPLKQILFGASAWFVSYPIMLAAGQSVSILMLLFYAPSSTEQVAVRYLRQTMEYPPLFISTAFLIIALVPIVEEVLFRGFLQTWLLGFLKRKNAIIITSVIFSLFHFSTSQGQNNVELLVSLFTLSCFLGFVYERQQSLWASIGLHMMFNGISVLFLTIQ